MAIIRFTDQPYFRNPWADFERMRRDMESFLSEWSGERSWGTRGASVYPALNIFEDEDAIYVHAELAGVPAGDLEIAVEGETLLLKGSRKGLGPAEKVSYHRREIQTGTFSRAISLPTKIDVAKIEAKLTDGILTIILPKAAEVKPRQIEVKVA